MTDSPEFFEIVLHSDGTECTSDEIAALEEALKSQGLPINPFRLFIGLTDPYRAYLYNLLEVAHPEVFKNVDDLGSSLKASSIMSGFLQEQLFREGIIVNEDVFRMLFTDFFCSRDFALRVRSKKGSVTPSTSG